MDLIFNWFRSFTEDNTELFSETCSLSESEFAMQHSDLVKKRAHYFTKQALKVLKNPEITTHQSLSNSDPNFFIDPYSILGIIKLTQMDKTAIMAGYPFLFELTEKFIMLTYLFVVTDHKNISDFDELVFDILNGIDYAERSPATLNLVHVKAQQGLRKIEQLGATFFIYKFNHLCILSNMMLRKDYPNLSHLRVTLYRYIASFHIIFERRAFDSVLENAKKERETQPPPSYTGTFQQKLVYILFKYGYSSLSKEEEDYFMITIGLNQKEFSIQSSNLSDKRKCFVRSRIFKLLTRNVSNEITFENLLKEVCYRYQYERTKTIDRLFEMIVFFSQYKQSDFFIYDPFYRDACFISNDGFKSKFDYLSCKRDQLFKEFKKCIDGKCIEGHSDHLSLSAVSCVCSLDDDTFNQDFPGMSDVREEFYRLVLVFELMPKKSKALLLLIWVGNVFSDHILSSLVIIGIIIISYSSIEFRFDYI